MTCPECAAEAGFPFKATTVAGGSAIDVAMRCHVCRHEWFALMDRIRPGQKRRPQFVLHQRAS